LSTFRQDQDQVFYLETIIKTKTLGLKTKTKSLFFVLEAPRWSRGLHHWLSRRRRRQTNYTNDGLIVSVVPLTIHEDDAIII